MKKLFLLTLMMIAMAGLMFSQTIRVDSPAKGEKVIKGSTHTIKWTLTGKQDTTVKINIFRNSIAVANFVEQLTGPNSGSIKWNVKNSYADGNYAIRIKTTDNKVAGDSGIFIIASASVNPPPPQTGTITVTHPAQGETIGTGTKYDIRWSKTGTLDGSVKINIFKAPVQQSNFAGQLSGPNNGTIRWEVKNDHPEGDYVIRVKTADGKVYGDSGTFKIKKSLDPGLPKHDPGKKYFDQTPQFDPKFQTSKSLSLSDTNPKIIKFTPAKTEFKLGEEISIDIHIENADSIRIYYPNNQGVRNLPVSNRMFKGTITIKPPFSTWVCLDAVNNFSKFSKEMFILNVIPAYPEILEFSFGSGDGTSEPGKPVDLLYRYKSAEKIYLKDMTEPKDLYEIKVENRLSEQSGTFRVNPKTTTTYQLILENPNERKRQNLDIRIVEAFSIEYFKPESPKVRLGERTTYSYFIRGAKSAWIIDNKSTYREDINIDGLYEKYGVIPIRFNHPMELTLYASDKDGKIKTSRFSIDILDPKGEYGKGIREFSVNKLGGITETSGDVTVRVMGAKTVKVQVWYRNWDKFEDVINQVVDTYRLFEIITRIKHSNSSGDTHFYLDVTYWDGTTDRKVISGYRPGLF